MAKTPSKYENEPDDDEPKAKAKAQPKTAEWTPSDDPANPSQLEPYPTGNPPEHVPEVVPPVTPAPEPETTKKGK